MFDAFDDLVGGIDDRFKAPVTRYTTFSQVASVVVNFLMWVGFAISISTFAFGMITIIMSRGIPEKTTKAKYALLYSVVAGAVSFLLLAIKRIFLSTLGVTDPIFTNNVPDL